jgi:RHS repeat-associated protein
MLANCSPHLIRINFQHVLCTYKQSGPVTINYTYDPLYRLTQADYSTGDYYHYAYDAVGNRLTETTQLATTNYVYDVANRLTNVNGVNYTWDNNGNLLSDGVNTYTYDSANRMISFNGQGVNAAYAYRCNGESIGQSGCESDRVSQTVNGVTTNYVLDSASALTQVLQDGTNTYVYGIDRIAQFNGTIPAYFLTDGLGSVRQLVDSNGSVTLAKSYQPYGTEVSSVGGGLSNYGFTNEYTSQGLIYLRSRTYSPETGRFLTRDSWPGDYNRPLSLNRWLYVEGNPVNRTDPSGQCYVDTGNLPKWQPWEWEWRVWEYPIVGPCRDNSGPISPDEPHWHEYWSANLVCSAWLNCSREEVVDALSRFTFPGQNPLKPVQPGQQSFVAPFSWFPGIELNGMPVEYLGAIQSVVLLDRLMVTNISRPTHIFHKGQVDRQAKQVGKAWYVVTHGTGNNIYFAMDVVNQETGAGIFTGVDWAMRQYLEAMHITNWIKGLDC